MRGFSLEAMSLNITQIASFKDVCTGCMACVKSCPVNCISSAKDDDGFYYPVVESGKCVDCSKCVNICPAEKEEKCNQPLIISAGYSTDESVRASGSSGGFVVELSKQIIEDGGIVYGAAFDAQKKQVCHTSSEEVPLEKLSRSKYVQSNTEDVHLSVKNRLEEGKTVLFCGTPCQVEGLVAFLGKSYSNLITVDFFCHGVPSVEFFEKTLSYYEEKNSRKIKDVHFRDKKDGWHKLALNICFDDGTEKRIPSGEQPYYYYFLNNYSLRKSCYSCQRYKSHVSDITVADYWTVNKCDDEDKGVSLILINTPEGEKAVNKIKDKIKTITVSDNFDFSIYKHNYSLKNRNNFFSAYKTKGFDYVCGDMFKKLTNKKNIINTIKRKIIRLLRK